MQNQQEASSGRQQENLQDFLPTTKNNPPMADPSPNNELEALRLVNQRLLQQNEKALEAPTRSSEDTTSPK